jgi:hypothetical protein
MEDLSNLGAGATAPGTDTPPPASPSEPSAIPTEPAGTVDTQPSPLGAQPGDTAPPPVEEEVAFSEEELKLLPQKTAERFARLTGYLKEKDSKIAELQTQVETKPEATTDTAPTLRVDAPVDEWDFWGQFNKFPSQYQQAMAVQVTDSYLYDRLPVHFEHFDRLSQEAQQALYHHVGGFIQSQTGLTIEEIAEAVKAYKGGPQGQGIGGAQVGASTAQGSLGPQIDFAQQLIDSGYEANDPLVLSARQQQAVLAQQQYREAQREREYKALEARLNGFETQTKQQTQAQQEQAERQRNAEFEQGQKAAWDTIIGSVKQTIPQGYEGQARYLGPIIQDAVKADSVAQTHLTNARNAFNQAHKFRQQGTPDLAEQAMSRYTRELGVYNARCAIAAQAALKDLVSVIAENVSLKNGATQQQQQRKDLLGGGGNGAAGNGLAPKRPDETADEYVARAAAYRREQTLALDAQR